MLHRSKLYAAGLLAAVFAAGIAVGTGVSAAASDRREPEPRGEWGGERESYATRRARELTLTPAQRDSVDRIVDGYQDSMSVFWSEMRPWMDAVRASIRSDIDPERVIAAKRAGGFTPLGRIPEPSDDDIRASRIVGQMGTSGFAALIWAAGRARR